MPATFPTLPTTYVVPTLDLSFAGFNEYTFDVASGLTVDDLRDFLRGISIPTHGILTRPAVIYLDPVVSWTLTGPSFLFVDDVTESANWLVITTLKGLLASLPTPRNRIVPATHSAVMPHLDQEFTNTTTLGININVDKVRLVGLRISHNVNDQGGGLIKPSRQIDQTIASTVAEICEDFIVDRCWIHAQTDITKECRVGIELNVVGGAVVDSHIERMRSGQDSQAVYHWMGDNTLIENNVMEAAGENYFTGGASNFPNEQPTNVTFRRNHVYKPRVWDENDPSYEGVPWSIKNLFELKMGALYLIEQCIFEDTWDKNQKNGIVFKATNQGVTVNDLVIDGTDSIKVSSVDLPFVSTDVGNNIEITDGVGFTTGWYDIIAVAGSVATLDASAGAVGSTGGEFSKGNTPWIQMDDITFRDSIVQHIPTIFQLIGKSSDGHHTEDSHRWMVDNCFGWATETTTLSGGDLPMDGVHLGGADTPSSLNDLTLRHLTLIHGDDGDYLGNAFVNANVGASSNPFGDRMDVRDCVVCHGKWGWRKAGGGVGGVSVARTMTNHDWNNMVLIDGDLTRNIPGSWPAPNLSWHETTAADIGFEDISAGNFRITKAGTNGDYRPDGDREASDGTVLGCDFSILDTLIDGVREGRPAAAAIIPGGGPLVRTQNLLLG